MNRGRGVEPTPPECAVAADLFDHFCAAGTMKLILALHREICATLGLVPSRLPDFYPKLKAKLASSWKAQALFKKFDARANHKVYGKGRACAGKVLIIGAGPCGLRAAIECQLLGAKVVVVEKRDRMSRNNVLHLWPFVIQDLRALGAKKFFGKFCAGSIDHISIRQLQCILMKVALLLGVEFHEGVSFEELLEPTVTENSETLGWRARVSPKDHPVSQYEFDALMGADGKRNTLQGFKRKEFRGKLAMAITANFINRHTEQEASVPEISGVAFIFNQKFFKELYEETGIDLENIVYYKDDTHYFVMTAKKHSLLDKGVLLNDYAEVSRLLSVDNVDRAALMRYAQEAARFSTDARLPLRDFALNHYGEPDVALFDFTSMYAAENASMVLERSGRRLLCQLVGDSLLEPFWPTGSGCARGFLSALDAAWAVRSWGAHAHPLNVVAERESVYRLLAQTTPENLNRDFGGYTLDPGTRYPNLNRAAVTPHRVTAFYDSDDPLPLDAPTAKKRRREPEVSDSALLAWVGVPGGAGLRGVTAEALAAAVRRYRPDLAPPAQPLALAELGIPPFSPTGSLRDMPDAKLRAYLSRVYTAFKGETPHVPHRPSRELSEQIKNQQREKHNRTSNDHSLAMYSNAAETNSRKKRRSVRTPHVSSDSAEYIRKRIGKLELNDITKLARLIEGHDAITDNQSHADKQKVLQEQIIAFLDPEEAPDPQVLRESVAQLLRGGTKTSVKDQDSNITQFFNDRSEKPVKPPRRLKGLDPDSIRVPDFTDLFDDSDTDVTLVPKKSPLKEVVSTRSSPKKSFNRSLSVDGTLQQNGNSLDASISVLLPCPESLRKFERSNSLDLESLPSENTKRIAQLFEGHKRRHAPNAQVKSTRSGSICNPDMARRMQRMTEMIEGKRRASRSPEKNRRESIGIPDMAARKQRVVELIQGYKPRKLEPIERFQPSDTSFRIQRASDIMKRRSVEAKRPKCGGRRKAAREIMRQRFEKSLQMLESEPRMDCVPSADLENDYGLQQYRADAINFGERVKKLEKKLHHYEEGRAVGGGSRAAGGGVRVARLAAELAGTTSGSAAPKASKPKDLMRSVGKIERDDWNVKEIERKIMENRLGRPEPRTAEKVPKWDREQFLGRQKRLKEGENEEKWVEIDETLHKLDQKLRDSGRPDHGTKKVANLATKFVKKDDPKPVEKLPEPKEELRKAWRGPAPTGTVCAACGARVFAAEAVTADGLTLHRACFRCAVCRAALRPGNYTMERYGTRLICLRHSGVNVPDSIAATTGIVTLGSKLPPTRSDAVPTPERISLELSDSGAREIDEDEWTDRNFLASETSGAGGLSDEEESSSDEYTDAADSDNEAEQSPEPVGVAEPRHDAYPSDDSFGYDDLSDDGGDSSGNESCSRMRAAREARRREVPADARPPTDSSEVESSDESSSSPEQSSATEVSTDSEFDDPPAPPAPAPPPAITVTEPPPPPPAPALCRTRSAGGLATKRALELKRKYLLGEASPLTVRRSDSTSQLDTKLQAFRSNITEFQKMLHPAPTPPVVVQTSTTFVKPMPDIIKNLCDAPVDLLTKVDPKKDWPETKEEKTEPELDSDSLSDSSHTATAPQPVPRVEVHDEGGELIQLDSLMLIHSEETDEKGSATSTLPTVVAAESESSESCRDATTLALTETELSDWAAESAVLEDCGLEDRDETPRRNPRTLSGPKTVHDAKNISAISSHVCGRSSPEPIVYSNALEHFEFADEGDQDPSIETPVTPRNDGYMMFVDTDYDGEVYSPGNDRSINFIERSFSETVVKPASREPSVSPEATVSTVHEPIAFVSEHVESTACPERVEPTVYHSDSIEPITPERTEPTVLNFEPETKSEPDLKSPQLLKSIESESSKSSSDSARKTESVIKEIDISINSKDDTVTTDIDIGNLSLSDVSPPLEKDSSESIKPSSTSKYDQKLEYLVQKSPPLLPSPPKAPLVYAKCNTPVKFPGSMRLYSPAICRSASDTFNRSTSRSTDSPIGSIDLSTSINFSSGSVSPASPTPPRDTNDKVQEIKREREEQTALVRKLVLQRLGSLPKGTRKSTRKPRVSPPSNTPPPVPPPPLLPTPLPSLPSPPPLLLTPPPTEIAPPRPAPPIMPLPVTPSFSDPELSRNRRRKSIIKSLSSISSYLNRRLGPKQKWFSEADLTSHDPSQGERCAAHKSTGALQEAPPVPPPPVSYRPPERPPPAKPPAEQQAATVAELVQVSAQREAHQALMAADRRRSGIHD